MLLLTSKLNQIISIYGYKISIKPPFVKQVSPLENFYIVLVKKFVASPN